MPEILESTGYERPLPCPATTDDACCDEVELPSCPPDAPPQLLYFANTIVNTATKTVTRVGVPLPLTDHDYKLIELLATQHARSLQHEQCDQDVA